MLPHFSFEKVNKLDWSNEFLDFVIAAILLMMKYDERPEADTFRKAKQKLMQDCVGQISDVPGLVQALRKPFTPGPYGASATETDKNLTVFAGKLSQVAREILKENSQGTGVSLSDLHVSKIDLTQIQDPVWRRTIEGFLKFFKEYDAPPYGGKWLPKHTNNDENASDKISPEAMKLFDNPGTLALVSVYFDLTQLCDQYGLKCWWAPLFYFWDEMSKLGCSVPVEGISPPTLDGLLGPVFRREISDKLTVEPGEKELSKRSLKEWLLFVMSRKDMRREFGIHHSRIIHEQMEEWCYHHNNKWAENDFDMLFDRTYLGLSIDNITEKYKGLYPKEYSFDSSLVQRHTSELARLLYIDLPKAFPKPRARH